jgi:hypothetical protein
MARPVWKDIYEGVHHKPDGDQDLIAVTRETLRLALSAIAASQMREAYHNYQAAWQEIAGELGHYHRVTPGAVDHSAELKE